MVGFDVDKQLKNVSKQGRSNECRQGTRISESVKSSEQRRVNNGVNMVISGSWVKGK